MKRILSLFLVLLLVLSVALVTASCNEEEEEGGIVCYVSSDAAVYYAGSTIKLTITARNDGKAVPYTGAAEDLFSATATATSDVDGTVVLTSEELALTDDATARSFESGEKISRTYSFATDKTIPSGAYTLTLSFMGEIRTIRLAFTVIGGGASGETTASEESTDAEDPESSGETTAEVTSAS